MDSGVGVRVERRVSRGQRVVTEEWTCTVDGPPNVDQRDGATATRAVRRDAGALVWRLEREMPNRPAVTVTERWSLSPDGRTLTVRSRPEGGAGLVEVQHEFQRLDGGRP